MGALLVAVALLAASDKPAAKPETTAAMQAAFKSLMSIQPLLASPETLRDPANAAKLKEALGPLSAIKHRFIGAPQEPGAELLAGMFGDAIDRARLDLDVGNLGGARARLRSVTSLCFACHTRQAATKDFEDATRQIDALNLPPLRKAEFFATTRQFDRATETWAEALKAPPKTEAEAFEEASALRQYVAVLVRVKDDRAATVALLSAQAARRDLPGFVARTLQRWLVDAKDWQADPFDAKTATPAALFAKARELVEASGATQSPMTDEGRFITLLRASGYLHSAMEKQPKAPFRGEALYLLGVASAATLDPLLWELDSLYLEGCIRENPHTQLARRCVERIYERTWFGWTGSAGTNVPADVAKRLGELKALAQ